MPESIDEKGWWKSPDKETLPECTERAKKFLKYLKTSADNRILYLDYCTCLEKSIGNTFAYVTHGGFSSILLQLIEGRPVMFDENSIELLYLLCIDTTPAINNCGMSLLRVDKGSVEVEIANFYI